LTEPESIPKRGLQWKQPTFITNPGCQKEGSIITQYLSEFIKSLGFDGVEFQSSMYPMGYNLAIFNPEKFECRTSSVYEIENITLNCEKIAT